jgi:hypothetical protein
VSVTTAPREMPSVASVVAEVLLHLADQHRRFAVVVAAAGLDRHRGEDLRQLVGEDGVDDHSGDLLDAPYIGSVSVALSHRFLFSSS